MRRALRRLLAIVVAALVAAGLVTVSPSGASAATGAHKFCAYSAQSLNELNGFQTLLGGGVDCATLFEGTASWTQWSTPWFLHYSTNPDIAWASWAKADPNRRLILTVPLAPTSNMPTNWLHLEATGAYNSYATQLARNLVNAGLSNTVIRLAPEANGDWNQDSVPTDLAGQADWRQAWANVVTAMRAVPGANFSFDWCVNYGLWRRRAITLNTFYPGDAYVDTIGLDAYDENTTSMTNRFQFELNRSIGIQEVYNYAVAHGKPMSMAEWGLIPVNSPMQGGGDDPGYMDGIGQFVATHNVAFTGYWYGPPTNMSLLQNSPASLSSLRNYFGAGGLAR